MSYKWIWIVFNGETGIPEDMRTYNRIDWANAYRDELVKNGANPESVNVWKIVHVF